MEALSPSLLRLPMTSAKSFSTKFGVLLRKHLKTSHEQTALIRTLLAEDRIFELLDFFQEHPGFLESFQKCYPGYLERFPILQQVLDFWHRHKQAQEIFEEKKGQLVENKDFSGLYLWNKMSTEVIFQNCNFVGTEFERCYITRWNLRNCDFTGAIFNRSIVENIEFGDGNNSMQNVSFRGKGLIENLQMLNTNCTGLDFEDLESEWGTYYYEELTLSRGCMPFRQHQKFQAMGTAFRHTPEPFYDIEQER